MLATYEIIGISILVTAITTMLVRHYGWMKGKSVLWLIKMCYYLSLIALILPFIFGAFDLTLVLGIAVILAHIRISLSEAYMIGMFQENNQIEMRTEEITKVGGTDETQK